MSQTEKIDISKIEYSAEDAVIGSMTAKEFCDKLRESIIKVVNGEEPYIKFPHSTITFNVMPGEREKLSTAYMRTILNRVPEVKAAGRASLKIERDDSGAVLYMITIDRTAKRKIMNETDLAQLERRITARIMKKLINNTPRITDLEGEEREGAIKMIKRYEEKFNEMMEGE